MHTRPPGAWAGSTHVDRQAARTWGDRQEPGTLGGISRRMHTRSVLTMDERWVRGNIFCVKACASCLMGGTWNVAGAPAHIHPPPRQACSRRIYAKHVQTIPLPVHSRDAACPRPARSLRYRRGRARLRNSLRGWLRLPLQTFFPLRLQAGTPPDQESHQDDRQGDAEELVDGGQEERGQAEQDRRAVEDEADLARAQAAKEQAIVQVGAARVQG